ncbi:MAG: Chondroitinase, partial [Patescibacteria group bacterium]|nr:Chondroitinase [Patescibacteria group bacterium]
MFLWLASVHSVAYAVTRNVVSSGGSGTSDCTTTACTMSRANAVVQPGDVVSIANGTYTTNIAPAVSGTAANPITYRGASTSASVPAATLSSKAYITLDNIKFDSVKNGWVTTNASSSNITITNCTFNSTDNGVSPTNYSYVGVSIQGNYNVLRNNTFQRWYGGDLVR